MNKNYLIFIEFYNLIKKSRYHNIQDSIHLPLCNKFLTFSLDFDPFTFSILCCKFLNDINQAENLIMSFKQLNLNKLDDNISNELFNQTKSLKLNIIKNNEYLLFSNIDFFSSFYESLKNNYFSNNNYLDIYKVNFNEFLNNTNFYLDNIDELDNNIDNIFSKELKMFLNNNETIYLNYIENIYPIVEKNKLSNSICNEINIEQQKESFKL